MPRSLVPIQNNGNTKFRYVQRTIGGQRVWGVEWASCSDPIKKPSKPVMAMPQISPAQFGPGAQFGAGAQHGGSLPFISGNWHSYGINVVSTPSEAVKASFPEFNKPCGK